MGSQFPHFINIKTLNQGKSNFSIQIMRGIFLIVGLTILCTPMIECSMGAFHFGKKKLNHASPKSNLKTVTHSHHTDDCLEDCGFELQLSLEMCKIDPANKADEDSFRTCLESSFSEGCHDCLCDTLASNTPDTPCAPPAPAARSLKTRAEKLSHRPDKDCYKDCGFVLHLSLELCKLTGPSPPPGTRSLSDEQDYIACLADHMQDEDCHDCLCDTLEAEGKNCYSP